MPHGWVDLTNPYIDAIEPLSKGVYDGYFVYSRGGDGSLEFTIPAPVAAKHRQQLATEVRTCHPSSCC